MVNNVGADSSAIRPSRRYLFLQGPITPFFKLVANRLEAHGSTCYRINLCFGDWLFWRGRDSLNFRGSQKQWPAAIARFLDEKQIDCIVLLGEQRFYHKQAIALAQSRGVEVVVTDFGYLRPDWIVLERNGMSAESEFPRAAAAIKKLAAQAAKLDMQPRYEDSFFRQVVWDISYHMSSTLLFFLYPGYRSHQIYHPLWVYFGTGLRLLRRKLWGGRRALQTIGQLRDKPYFIFPLQMQNDFQIRAYSRYAGVDEALEEVIASFAQHSDATARLVVKVHPLDPGIIGWQKKTRQLSQQYGVANRVVYIDGGSLSQLIKHALGLVTINSTVGLWSLRAHLPTKVLGEAVYAVEGLVQGSSLDEFWTQPQAPDPELLQLFLRALAGSVHLRGVYYNEPGLSAAAEEASQRLMNNCINRPLVPEKA